MDTTNVTLRLTENEKILAVLRERGALVPDEHGVETHWVQFDSRAFAFQPGKKLTFPKNVAECINRPSILMGGTERRGVKDGQPYTYKSALDARWVPIFDVVESWTVGDEAPSVKAARATSCGVCGKDMKTVKALIAHLAEHEEQEQQGEPVATGAKSTGKK